MALDGMRYAKMSAALRASSGPALARESNLAAHLPYFTFANPDVMVLREGDLMATLRLDGLAAATTPDSDLDAMKRAVAAIIAQTGNLYGFYVHRIFVPQELAFNPIAGDGFAAEVDRRWQAHVASLNCKKPELYLSILRRPDIGAGIPLLNSHAKRTWMKSRDERAQELNEVTGFLKTALAAAKPIAARAGVAHQ